MKDCIFCKIINGDLPSAKIYEDERVLAFLTIEQINPGHALVIPKNHVEQFQDIQSDEYINVMQIVQKIAKSLEKTYKPKRVGLMVQGFEVAHAHIHVAPLFEETDITSKKLLDKTANWPSPEEMQAQASQIKTNL